MGRQEETGHGAGKQGHAEKNGGGGAMGLRARLDQREGRRAEREMRKEGKEEEMGHSAWGWLGLERKGEWSFSFSKYLSIFLS